MKKKLLSFILAVVMVASTFSVISLPVSAASKDSKFTYEFEETDARNYVDGQVIDLAALGEANKAPTLSGDKSEYQISTSFNSSNGSAPLNVYLSVKDGYLYVAFEAATQQRMQYDLGVAQDHRSDRVWNRARFVWNVDNSFTNQTPIIYAPGTNTEIPRSSKLEGSNALVDKDYNNGLQEAKISLEFIYRYFAGTGAGQGIYDSPCVTLSFYNVGTGVFYYNKLDSAITVDSTRAVNYLPYTIIIPDESFDLICDKKGDVGALGTDNRNAVVGQLSNIPNYAEVAPTVDANIDFEGGEYTIHKTIGNADTYYAVKDGYLYIGVSYADTTSDYTFFYYGLASHSEVAPLCFFENVIRPSNNTVTNKGITMRNPLSPASKIASTDFFSGAGLDRADSMVAMESKNDGSKTTFEVKISIPVMVSMYEDAGWETEAMNTVQIILGPAKASLIRYDLDATTYANIRTYSGLDVSCGWAYPTVQLPKGCVEKYSAQGVDKLEGFGQKHVNAGPSEVKLDGIIGASEYTGNYSYTKDDLRSGDSVLVPDITYDIGGTNYFAYDKDNLYVGAKVYDPNYISEKSTYQLNIGVIDKNAKIDVGFGVTRMAIYARVIDGNRAVFAGGSEPSVTIRTQDHGSADESAWKAIIPDYDQADYAVAGSYDEATKTITYEIKIPLSVLKTAFGVDDIETLSIFNYLMYVPTGESSTAGAWNIFKPVGEQNGAIKALENYTLMSYGISTLAYTNSALVYGDIVHLIDADTKPGASVRLSNADLSGIRFKSTYSDEFLAEMKALADARGVELEIGTIITPAYYVEKAGAFTFEALDKLLVSAAYITVKATVDAPFSSANGTTTYAGSLVNIKSANLARNFAGIGYVKVGDSVYYNDSYTVRSISEIAKLALADVSDVATGNYTTELENGKFSCYKPSQITILNGFTTDEVYVESEIGAYKHVVIIGADGAGTFDTDTPNIDRIFANGGVSKNVTTAIPTISAQAWTSLLHGVTPDKHWTTNYDAGKFSYTRDLYPSVLKVLEEINPNYNIGSIARWSSINVGIVEDNAGIYKVNSTSDANVTVDVCHYVKESAPEFLFVQYNQADGAGESYGFTSTEYYDAIKWVDAEIGKIYDAYDQAGLLDDTLFIVTADHGGFGKKHGGVTDIEKTIMVAALGSTVVKGENKMQDMEIRDLAAVAMYALGYKSPETWSGRVPTGFFEGVEGGERPVYVDEYASRYHISTETPAKETAGYITNFLADDITLVNYINFDNNTTDQMGGTTVANGTIPYVDGYFGQGADLSTGHVTVEGFDNTDSSFTIAFWFNTNGLQSDPAFISNKNWNSGSNPGFVISLALNSDGSPMLWVNAASSTSGSRIDFRPAMPKDYMDGWVHAIVTFDLENGEIRICYDFDTNNVYKATMPDALKNSTTPFAGFSSVVNLGQDGTGNYGAKTVASIDEYMLFSGAFDNADIAALAAYYGK